LIENEIKIIKAFKSKIKINNSLKELFKQSSGNRRFIYNQLLNIIKTSSKSNIKKINYNSIIKINDKNYNHDLEEKQYKSQSTNIHSKKGLQNLLTTIQDDYPFLSKSHSQSNQEGSHSLSTAYKNYLDPKMKNFGEPKFKRKNDLQSFYLPNQNNIQLKVLSNRNSEIYIKPFDRLLSNNYDILKENISNINKIFIKSKIPKEIIDNDIEITGITISFDKLDNYFISINYKYSKIIKSFETKDIINSIKNNRTIGIDLGLKNKVNDNLGKKFKSIIDNKIYKELELKQKKLQKKLSKKVELNKKKLIKKKIIQRVSQKITKYPLLKTNLSELTKKQLEKVVSKSNLSKSSINQKSFNKLIKSRKRNKYSDKIILDRLLFKIIKTDNSFSKKEWRKIYNDLSIKKYQSDILKLENKLTNIRTNENHNLSKYIVDNNDFIFMEDLTLSGMVKLWGLKMKKLQLSKLTNMIKYKSENQGKIFIQIDKWFPSSKTCSSCENKKDKFELKEPIYNCSNCNLSLDRDVNASINILKEGFLTYLRKVEEPFLPIDLWKRISFAVNQLTSNVSVRNTELEQFCVVREDVLLTTVQ